MKEAMMRLDFTNVDSKNINNYEEKAMDAFKTLMDGSGEGNDFLGWIDRPINYDKEEFERIKKAAAKIQDEAKFWFLLVLVVPT